VLAQNVKSCHTDNMKRTIYKQLLDWKHSTDRKPLLLKGARQVGKTYLLEEFGRNEFQNTIYLNFEKNKSLAKIFSFDLDPKRILSEIALHFKKKINIEHDLLIFDEIQACPEALTSLKYFCEELPSAHVACAGSLLGVYLSPVSYPVGKVDKLYMHPMSFGEFLLALGDEELYVFLEKLTMQSTISDYVHEYLWERLKCYFVVGGLPEVVALYVKHRKDSFVAFEKTRQKQRDLIDDYYADIAKHSGKVNAMHIKRIWQSVPEQLASTQDGSAKKFKFREAVKGVDRYSKLADAIDWLENAGLIIKIHIVSESKIPLKAYKKENSFKLVLFDVGILGAMCDLDPATILAQDYGSYKGFFAENYVAQAFTYKDPQELYAWEGKTSEIEFVRQHNSSLIPYEVKSGWVTQSKSLKVYQERYHPDYRVILSAKQMIIDLIHHIHHYPLYLASYLPLDKRI
jgi:predicted AAA+ superfamily ATPase